MQLSPRGLARRFLRAAFGLMRQGGVDLLSLWIEATWPRRVLYGSGGLLLASGGFHTAVFAVRGGGWQGPLSWRKPILFGISGGLTALSVAWVEGLISEAMPASRPRHRAAALFCHSFSLFIVAEVALITMQTWRGVPSHFNEATRLDYRIFYAIGVLITLITLQIIALGLAAYLVLPQRDDRAEAARSGLLLLIVGCLLGFWVLRYGVKRSQAGLDPGLRGKAGVMKFPHGLPIHAIQFLAFQSWLMRQRGLGERTRLKMVQLSAAGNFLITGYGCMQTVAGRGRFSTTAWSAAVLGVGLLLFMAPFACCIPRRPGIS